MHLLRRSGAHFVRELAQRNAHLSIVKRIYTDCQQMRSGLESERCTLHFRGLWSCLIHEAEDACV